MIARTDFAAEDVPGSLGAARRAAADCQRCDLYRCGTQTVFGEGRLAARLMLVGEQPGDREDVEGRPFVGPAGRVLDEVLQEAGIDRRDVYVTNAVKHFKYRTRGKRRMHEKPNAGEIDRCRWWLDLERLYVAPQVVVALGATALRGLTGRSISIRSLRGSDATLDDGTALVATVHPSYLLRLRDREAARGERSRFVDDLARARDRLAA